jgi:glutathione S-transferase
MTEPLETVWMVYGRPDSSAVARVMWTLGELQLPYRRLDWGGRFGGNDDPAYRRLNPTGRIPTIVLPGGEALWESNAIIRSLASQHSCREGGLWPLHPHLRAQCDAWMDWSRDYQSAVSRVREAYKTPNADAVSIRAAVAAAEPALAILERQLEDRRHVAGEELTVADLSLGVWAHRWFRVPEDLPGRPALPATEAWYHRLRQRPPYLEHVVEAVSTGAQTLGGLG